MLKLRQKAQYMIPTCFLYSRDARKLTPLLKRFEYSGQFQLHSRAKEVVRGKVLKIIHVPKEREIRVTLEWVCTRGFAKKNHEVKNTRWIILESSMDGKPYTLVFRYQKFYSQRKGLKPMNRLKLKGKDESCRFYLSDDPANIDIAKILESQ